MPHIGFKQAKESGLLVKGAQILSYPDHKGERRQGVITAVNERANLISVKYDCDPGSHNGIDLNFNGRITEKIDTSLDINLILIEE